jgi:mono/diheme cytochrome c family protein
MSRKCTFPFNRIGRVALWQVVAVLALASAARSEEPVRYSRDIKPLLSGRCYACHGPDAEAREGELRLDLRNDAIKQAITPGDAAKSKLLARLTSDDPDERMPPADSNKEPLSDAQIELVRRWVDEGAPFEPHWAYNSPKQTEPPAIQWGRNEIDRFIAAAHRQQGLRPAAEADPRTLIRRLYFDLTGLPPSPAEVEAFVKDPSDEAYTALVERLLASDQFGERMAMYWLDQVRFADTNGIHGDNHRDHALYRDYVIRAFNENLPFDQFTTEQIAGDLLPQPTAWQRVASGYNRLNMTTREGGAQAKEYMAKYAADRVRATSSVWLGGTMGCCECHDHKFDPYTMKDFYSFAAFFADVQETAVGTQAPIKLPTPDEQQQLDALDSKLAAARSQLQAEAAKLSAAQAEWESLALAKLQSSADGWTAVRPLRVESSGGATLTIADDLSVLSAGKNPAKDNYSVELPVNAKQITGVRLEALTHDRLTNKSLSRGNGNFVLTQFVVERIDAEGKRQPVKIASAVADFEQAGWPIKAVLNGKPNTGWAPSGHTTAANRAAVFSFAQPVTGGAGVKLLVTLRHESVHPQHNIGRFRISVTASENPSLDGSGLLANVAAALQVAKDQRNDAQRSAIAEHFQSIAPQLRPLSKQIADLEAAQKKLTDSFQPILVTTAGQPRTMRILPRGNWLDETGPVVSPAVPEFLGVVTTESDRATRLDLARWLTSDENPVVARVAVNRLWKICFGEGLVRTLDDFGSQGAWPSHPELLDWLAVEFREGGWDVKQMLRLIVHSAAYRQSSSASDPTADPANRWLARQNRFRLDAELVRDNALAVSGLLVNKIGGPSVKPYQPSGYWKHLNFPKRTYQADSGENQYRRGMYTYWCRTFLHPSLLAFDAPSREESCVRRPRSNTPLQALVLLNDPTYVEAARALATRIVTAGGDSDASRLEFAMRAVLARRPTDAEREVLLKLYHQHHEQFDADAEAAARLLATGQSKPPADVDAAELAAWTSVARVLLNLHETITRY